MVTVNKNIFLVIVSALVGLVSFSSQANANSLSVEAFAKSKLWHKLLHIKPSEPGRSYIVSDNFFLAQDGSWSPQAELESSIREFYLPLSDNASPGEHAQCRFPARLLAIKQHLNLTEVGELPNVACSEFRAWQQKVQADSLSLVFASGYMSNPASMYGHLFIKFNGHNYSHLLDTSVNYGALVPNGENPIVYVLRGIFGGYEAGYSDQQFFRHQHNYSDVELRDMWEYKLALEAEDVALLAAHLWEVLPQRFDYYFIDENCAFHFARLLELFTDAPVISDESLWVLPNAVASGVAKASYKGEPLLRHIEFIQSRETQLRAMFVELTQRQQALAKAVIDSNFSFLETDYLKLPELEKKLITEALLQYLNVRIQQDSEDADLQAQKRRLLQERMRLPPGKARVQNALVDKAGPHFAMPYSKFSTGLARVGKENFATLGFRMTYFDDLSSSVGRNKFTNLEMMDIELIANDTEATVLKFDLIDIKSLYLPPLPWHDEWASAWSIRGGFEQFGNDCTDCGVVYFEGDRGVSGLLNKNLLSYAMLGGRVFAGQVDDIAVYAKLGILSTLFDKLSLKFEMRQQYLFDTKAYEKHAYKLELNYAISHDFEARLALDKQQEFNLALKLNYYWGF